MSVQRLIPEEYWSQFIIKDKETSKKRHDGSRFEELVNRLLNLMYKGANVDWIPTQITHDGNKDFKASINQDVYWAECKNYKTKIDLKTLAATLVMAEIEDVNVILFFCYSQINDSTKKKLNSFSKSTNKVIYFYDGQVLDQLILKYANEILPDFFPEFKEIYKPKNYENITIAPTVVCYVERNPSFKGSVTFDIKKLDELQNLKVGEIIGIHVIIINNNITNELNCSYKLSFEDNCNPFEILDDSANKKNNCVIWDNFELAAGATLHKIIYLKLKNYYPVLEIPKLTCNIANEKRRFQFGTITALETTHCAFMGSCYLNQLNIIPKHCLDKKNVSGILLYGQSGTGKTRMLHECSDNFLSAGYQIINFCNMQSSYTTYAMLHELIFALYGFTDELIELIIENDYEKLSNYNTDKYKEIFRILKILYQNKSDIGVICDEEFISLYEKIARGKYFLAFDDVQYLPDASINFIKGFWNYALNIKRDCQCVLAIAVNTDTLFKKNTIEFLSDFGNNDSEYRKDFYKCELTGFENGDQAEMFLKEVLRINDEELHFFTEYKHSLCPKYILHTANYLLDKQVIKTVNNKMCIVNNTEFKDHLRRLPNTITEVIEKRWHLFCEKYKNENYKRLLCILLFWGKLDCTDALIASLYSEKINVLVKHCFLKESSNNSNVYIFEHDSIMYFFKQQFLDWFECALVHIGNSKYDSHVNVQKILCSIHQNKYITEKDINSLRKLKLPENIRCEFYIFLLKTLLTQNESLTQIEYSSVLKEIFNNIREELGEKDAERLYQIFEETYNLESEKLSVSEYQDILLCYAENQLKLKSVDKAINIYSNIIEKFIDLSDKNDLLKLSAIYNRWFVCGRIGGSCQQYEWQWKESMKIAQKNGFCSICIENLFDKAQSFMTDISSLDKVIYYLTKGCDAYEYKQIPFLRGHYLFRQIQLLFLKKEYDKIWDKVQSAKNEISINKEIKFKLFFKIQLLIFEIMICLMGEHDYSDFIIEDLLESLNSLQCMQNRLQLYRCYYLYGKYYIKKGKWEKAYLIYQKAFENLNENSQTEEIKMQKKIIFRDMAVNFKKSEFPISHFDFSFLNTFEEEKKIREIMNYSDNEFKDFFKNYTAYAIVSDRDGKEGYLLF